MLLEIGKVVYESQDFTYDSIGISEDGKTLGIGFINNASSSILIHELECQINVSFNKNVGPYEALKFFMLVLEKLPTKVLILNDFA
jgi:hypothetical protein